ncbi:hypothetical protein [Variovorax soli]|uniref:Uncharacterized protein n=1 Tax=Variovorax soli TaxID=376815 RepID=A0ABU1NM30_9BURK|nr:hypothetical protein [Variovorax soli]MDR6539502.1 hypothetical protein [Variovorax soli]
MDQIKNDLRSQRWQAYSNVHAVVADALGDMKGLPEDLRSKYEQAAAELTDETTGLESALHNFEIATSSITRWAASQRGGDSGPNARYGGTLGHAIFDEVIRRHTIPTLKACLARFFDDACGLSYDELKDALRVFLPVLLDVAAQDRRAVATMSGTADAHEFGAPPPVKDLGMCDSIGMDWKPWSGIVFDKVFSLLGPHVEPFFSNHSKPTFSEFLRSREVSQDEQGRKVVVFADSDKAMRLTFDLTNPESGSAMLNSMPYSGRTAFYTFEWSTKGADGRLNMSDLKCFHPPAMAIDALHEIAPHVLSALAWTPACGVDDLQDSLAKILHTMSHSSTFHRGQASIVEMLIQSIALLHDFRVDFSPAWSRPNAQPDQHALSEFDLHRFVLDARNNLRVLATG